MSESSDPPRTSLAPLSRRPAVGAQGENAVRSFVELGGDPSEPGVRDVVAVLGEHAPALLPLATGDPSLPRDVLHRPLERADTEESLRQRFFDATEGLGDDDELRRVLRRLRHRTLVRIALREVLRLADVDQTSREMAALASACVDAALAACTRSAEQRYGVARDADGNRVPLTVLGMGKLGGHELNLGSDIDLCAFYGTDDATVGDDETSPHELYARIVSRTVNALSEPTDHGFCFRVDMRLRPEGSGGPLVNSLASAERYYESWGRTWERAALLRARPIAGDRQFGDELLETLRPFVFRRAVDPGIAREVTELLRRTRRELRVDGERDVKLGRGGIREAEFFVQTLQLIWGGRHPELQVRGTIDALHRLRAAGLVSHREAESLEADWALLRRVEHRIHMRTGYQTHAVPTEEHEREAFAASLGFDDGDELTRALQRARERVAQTFDSLLEDESETDTSSELERLCDVVAAGASATDIAEHVPAALPVRDSVEAASHLLRLGRPASAPLGAVTRERAHWFGPMLLRELRGAADPDSALRFVADFFARLGGPGGYDRLLMEHPRLLRRLVGLFGASATLSSALVGHPEAIDNLLTVGGPPDPEAVRHAHDEIPLGSDVTEEPDPEAFVQALRRLKRETTLQVGLAYVSGEIALGDVEDLLTVLAESQIAAALRFARTEAFARLGRPQDDTDMVVAGMGKLGAGELGFGSDLDMVFLYGAEGEAEPVRAGRHLTHGEVFTRVAQRTMRLLSQPDFEGPGYETDTRLRPSGAQGMLVVSLAAFDRYHERRAQAWERQALVRARPVAGDPALSERVAKRFEHYAYAEQPPDAEELARMRGRIETELSGERPGHYHAKLGYGGLVDAEFVVQWLQMCRGTDEPALRYRRTLDALHALKAHEHLDAADADALDDGVRFFRQVEQAIKLLDETAEPALRVGHPIADQVARRLGLRERDGHTPTEVLVATWQGHATELRSIFERRVAPVGVEPPWGEAGST